MRKKIVLLLAIACLAFLLYSYLQWEFVTLPFIKSFESKYQQTPDFVCYETSWYCLPSYATAIVFTLSIIYLLLPSKKALHLRKSSVTSVLTIGLMLILLIHPAFPTKTPHNNSTMLGVLDLENAISIHVYFDQYVSSDQRANVLRQMFQLIGVDKDGHTPTNDWFLFKRVGIEWVTREPYDTWTTRDNDGFLPDIEQEALSQLSISGRSELYFDPNLNGTAYRWKSTASATFALFITNNPYTYNTEFGGCMQGFGYAPVKATILRFAWDYPALYMHELSHMLGLHHCDTPYCVMNAGMDIIDFDHPWCSMHLAQLKQILVLS